MFGEKGFETFCADHEQHLPLFEPQISKPNRLRKFKHGTSIARALSIKLKSH